MEGTVKKAILPAAGLGTRFLPATKASPKEMLPIVDKPMIQYAVEEATACGIEDFLIITGKHKRAIEDHFDSAFELEANLKRSGKKNLLDEINKLRDVNFAYIRQKAALGLGHAVLCARPFVKDEPFAVLLSDIVIPRGDSLMRNMIRLYGKLKCPIIAVTKVKREEVSRYGIIDGIEESAGIYRIKDLVEKPRPGESPSDLAIMGRYVLTPDIFGALRRCRPGRGGEIQLTDAIKGLLKKQAVYGYLFEDRWYDAGDKLGFLTATVDMALENPELSKGFRRHLIRKISELKE
ncbi:MAG: UTP--glucose-1-phosphate uridylyltransferase GalU [Thermodesulfovibrionales bacterium]|nr:UTP--glucose-1-phosphate uridylyltransferase GalU [Thermodesulfovibrionales bacterium]